MPENMRKRGWSHVIDNKIVRTFWEESLSVSADRSEWMESYHPM